MDTSHRTFKVHDPVGEIAIVQRPGNLVKMVYYPKTGDHMELLMEKEDAFNFAMEILQHVYRLG